MPLPYYEHLFVDDRWAPDAAREAPWELLVPTKNGGRNLPPFMRTPGTRRNLTLIHPSVIDDVAAELRAAYEATRALGTGEFAEGARALAFGKLRTDVRRWLIRYTIWP